MNYTNENIKNQTIRLVTELNHIIKNQEYVNEKIKRLLDEQLEIERDNIANIKIQLIEVMKEFKEKKNTNCNKDSFLLWARQTIDKLDKKRSLHEIETVLAQRGLSLKENNYVEK